MKSLTTGRGVLALTVIAASILSNPTLFKAHADESTADRSPHDVDIVIEDWVPEKRDRLVIVTGGAADAQDWVVEQLIDVSFWDVAPTRAAVVELDANHNVLGRKASQFDMEAGHAVITWIMDGKLPAAGKRFFRIEFGKDSLAPSARVGIREERDSLVVLGTGVTLRHDREQAGLMVKARVGKASVGLTQHDMVGDAERNSYYPKDARIRVVARGPIRTAIEVQASYLDEKGAAPLSNARVEYRYTTLLGMPVTRIVAFLEQDSAKSWREVEVGQFTFDRQFKNWALNVGDRFTGQTTGALAKTGFWRSPDRWGAVYDPDFMIGITSHDGTRGGADILDVKAPNSSCLFRSPPTPWWGPSLQRVTYVFFGRGPQDLDSFESLANVLWDPPKTKIIVPQEIQEQIAKARSHLAELENELASAGAETYIAGSTMVDDAKRSLRAAEELAAGGNFRGATGKLGAVNQTRLSNVSHQLERDGQFLTGRVGSSIIVANKHVSFGFADAKRGAGLTGIWDLAAHRLSLTSSSKAHLWEITLKDNQGKQYLVTNRGAVPSVSVNIDRQKAEATFLMNWGKISVGTKDEALTAPWCRGGPLSVRKDIPKWIKDIPSIRDGRLGGPETLEFQKQLAGLPYGAHCYSWMKRVGWEAEAPYGEYIPEHGDEWFRKEVKKAQASGVRIIPYTNSVLWYTGLESFKTDAIPSTVKGKDGSYLLATYAGRKFGVMCPGTKGWRDKVTAFSLKLVEDGVDGIYFDQTFCGGTGIWAMCFDETHGHPLLGGNWWVKATRECLDQVRTACREKNPEAIFTGEGIYEPLIDSMDIFLVPSLRMDDLPIFPAVYGGYAMAFGARAVGEDLREVPYHFYLTRWFIWGEKGGWNGVNPDNSDPEAQEANRRFRSYLLCYDRFARPFLTYGQMIRPPSFEGDIPKLLSRTGKTLDVPAVEAMAWRTLDGQRVGIFIANYSEVSRTVTWQTDLGEELGWGASEQIKLRRWDHDAIGPVALGNILGGTLRRTDKLDPGELLVLELER